LLIIDVVHKLHTKQWHSNRVCKACSVRGPITVEARRTLCGEEAGAICLQNDLNCVGSGVKLHSVTRWQKKLLCPYVLPVCDCNLFRLCKTRLPLCM